MAFLYLRDNGVWYVQFKKSGRACRRSTGATDRNEAERILESVVQLEDNAPPRHRTTASIKEFWKQYEQWAIAHCRPATVAIQKGEFWRFATAAGIADIGDITKKRIEDYKRVRLNAGKAPRSVNTFLTHIKAVINRGIELGLCAGPNPFIGVSLLKVEKDTPRFLELGEVERLLTAAQAHSTRIHTVFALGLYAGFRKNEIVNARWEWFNFERELITLSSGHGFKLKSREARTLPMSDKLARALAPRLTSGFLFPPGKQFGGKGVYRVDFSRPFVRVCREANLMWVTPHVLRHTFASQLAIAGVSILKISKWLGHSDIKTTMIYAHLNSYDADINRY